MKQRKLFLLALMVMTSLGTMAQSVDFADGIYITYDDGVVYHVGHDYNDDSNCSYAYIDNAFGDITIRGSVSYNGVTYPVTRIENSNREVNTTITSVTIEEGVTADLYNSFMMCENITSVIIPNSITTIGGQAFAGCSSLASISIPNSVTKIGWQSFAACSNLKYVTFEENSQLEIIQNEAFQNSGLVSLRLPASIKKIEGSSFLACEALEEIVFPSSSRLNEDNTDLRTNFGCSNLKNVYAYSLNPIPVSESEFFIAVYEGNGNGWFVDWEHCPEDAVLHVPEEAIELYKNADGWSRFKHIVSDIFEENGTQFQFLESNNVCLVGNDQATGKYAIPHTVTHKNKTWDVTAIAARAFMNRSGLTELTIPRSIKEIGENAFAGCMNLKAIYNNSTKPIDLGISSAKTRGGVASSVFEGVDKENCVLYVPQGCVEAYRAAEGWGEFTHIVEMGSTGISSLYTESKSNDVYDLQGRKVCTGVTSLEGLPKGVYIVRGRKVIH